MRYARVTGFHYACVLTIKNWIGVQVYFCSDKPEQNKERYDFIEKKLQESDWRFELQEGGVEKAGW